MKSLLLFVFLSFAPFQDTVEEMVLGKWTYAKGSYEYYDAGNHKLKESQMNAISDLEIQLSKDNVAVISFSKARSRSTTYSLSKNETGKYCLNAALSGNPFKYEIMSIGPSSMVLLSKSNTSFFIDGDVNKKVAYALVKIYLERKP